MECLPVELRQTIFEYLDLQGVKAIRLVSKSWAALGEDYLINPLFRTLPSRDDFRRLHSIAMHSSFSSRIERIEFDMGEVNEYHARHNSYFILYTRDPEDRFIFTSAAWQSFTIDKQQCSAFQENYCNQDLLTESFKNLPRLSAIDLSLCRCPFDSEILQQIWQFPTTRLLPRVQTTQRFTNILTAAAPTAPSLQTISHDRLPFEFWGQKQQILNDMAGAFKGLHTLKLVCDYDYSFFSNDLYRTACFDGLGFSLKSAPGLQKLHIAFQGSVKTAVNFQSFVGDFTWPRLHTLVLAGVSVSEHDVSEFLARHAASLTRLQLGGSRIQWYKHAAIDSVEFLPGSLKGFLSSCGKNLKLEKLNCRGDVLNDFGKAQQESVGLYDDDWTLVQDPEIVAKVQMDLEDLAIRGGEWPIHESEDETVFELI